MISVVIPLYNKEASIAQSLKSVLSQEYDDFEVVIVDDGSTDESVGVVEAINDPRIRLIKQARCFSGRASMSCRTICTFSRCTVCSYGLAVAVGLLSTGVSSSDAFWFSCSRSRSSAMLRQTVSANASMFSMVSHESRRFQTRMSVSCTMSSASSRLSVMRSARR